MRFRHFRLSDPVRAAVNNRIQPWHRYHGFLSIIRERYEANAKRYDPNPKPGIRFYLVTQDVHQHLQLDVETFYLFANMMLDQIASNIRFFFGFARGKPTRLQPLGEDWTHLTVLDKLEQEATVIGLTGNVADIITQGEEFRKLRTYRNSSITHWDASDTHLGSQWNGTDLTIHLGLVGKTQADIQQRIADGFWFQMTVPVPSLYDLLDNYAASVQLLLEANDSRFIGA